MIVLSAQENVQNKFLNSFPQEILQEYYSFVSHRNRIVLVHAWAWINASNSLTIHMIECAPSLMTGILTKQNAEQ